jgi:hypothetical protein
MTKTSSFYLRSDNPRAFFVAAALVLKPFGPVASLVKDGNVWHGFHDDGPMLVMMRAEKVPTVGKAEAICKRWIESLETDSIGHDLGGASKLQYAAATPDWGPWKSEEIEGIEHCDKQPCDVKLDGSEVAQMAATPKAGRRAKYLELILDRVQRYIKTQERKEYEFPGDPLDPWKVFVTLGLSSPLPIPPPSKGRLELRRVEFFPGRVKTMHQILDTRVAEAADGQEATLWRRDAYTDHYFDSWGEWADVGCGGGGVTVTQAVMLELDLMKKTDLLSKLMRSKMRGAAEDNGAIYLNGWFERLKKSAGK